MRGRVPLARRALFQDRRRAALAAGGVAAALLLVLLLQGIFDGAMRQATAYLRASPADVIVSQRDVRTMHMSVSALDPATDDAVRAVDGVAWAEGLRYTTTFLVGAGDRQQLSYVIGYDTATGRGGPRRLSAGRPPGPGEILVERIAADRLGLRLGDRVGVFGGTFRVSGLFHGGTTIANSAAFIRTEDFAAGTPSAYVLVGARPGVPAGDLARRVAAAVPGDTVQTTGRFAREEAALVRDMSADLMRIMSTIGLLIALAVIALTLFTLTLAKLREHAVVKALGGRTRRLAAVVLAEAAWSVALAVAVATAAAVVLGAVVGRVNPAVAVAVTPAGVVRVGLSALAVGAVGAIVPLRRVVAVDPASAFRRAS
ncbi:MAG TPA: ABC transporter permease [Acidimicrobiales bacterium]|nr:ABC transporter permease [Acidimicrobiales bacterium]